MQYKCNERVIEHTLPQYSSRQGTAPSMTRTVLQSNLLLPPPKDLVKMIGRQQSNGKKIGQFGINCCLFRISTPSKRSMI